MQFALSEEQNMMRESAIQMVERDIQPILDKNPPDMPLPKAEMLRIYAVLARQGLMAPRLPESAGGSGMGMLSYGLMFEQLPAMVAISLLAHECTIARMYAESRPDQRERLLPDLFAGRKICCTGTTEPDIGSDPRGVKTRVRTEGDALVINGSKAWITNASICDIMNVTCGEPQNDGPIRLRRIAVERDKSSFKTHETETLGLRQGHLAEVVFEDCRVPTANALGAAGDAARVLTLTWNGNRPLVGLAATQLAQKAFDAAVAYSGVRKQFGKAIGGFQLIQKNLADIQTAITTSRLLCYHALDAIDRGDRANGTSAMAKRYATTACQEAISLAIQVHGAMGISREAKLETLYRDARMLPIPDATNEILALIQGREITGMDAFRA
jgi:alkylation response protein AidB-like acyl-CoA dehydrogenase